MKPFHYFLSIAGVTLLVGGGMALQANLKYQADGREIAKLISEYKAMGIPTNGDEFWRPIHSDENAWVEIGPLLMNKNGRGNGPLYRGGISLDLIYAGTKKDLPTMRKYLKKNQEKRDQVLDALRKKPKMQVPHDYDEGYMMLLPEYATMKTLCKDFCLEAYVAGLEGDTARMITNLDAATRFAHHCFDRGELIGSMVGLAIQRQILDTGFRLMEVQPSLRGQIIAYLSAPEFLGQKNLRKVLHGEFLSQVVTTRYLDSPLVDKRRYPSPIDKVFKNPTTEEIMKSSQVRKGDYLPESRSMRAFLRRRLEECKPFMTQLSKQGEIDALPSEADFAKFFDYSQGMPTSLSFLYPNSVDSRITYKNMSIDLEYADVARIILKAVQTKDRTGSYPDSMNQMGMEVRSYSGGEGYEYFASEKGVIVNSVRLNLDSKKPAVKLSFPPSLAVDPVNITKRQEVLRDYRTGKVNDQGIQHSLALGPQTSLLPPAGAPKATPKVVSPGSKTVKSP